jgi:transcriptional regulator with XRE-family HTH domain
MAGYEEFGAWLRDELGRRGWDHVELARRGGVSRSHISRLASGERLPGPDTAQAIARGFRIPVDEVYRRAGLLPEQRDEVPETEQMRFYLERLPEDERRRLVIIARALYETICDDQPDT